MKQKKWITQKDLKKILIKRKRVKIKKKIEGEQKLSIKGLNWNEK